MSAPRAQPAHRHHQPPREWRCWWKGYPYGNARELVAADLLVVLDEVTDPRNVGAVARCAWPAAQGLVLPGAVGRRHAGGGQSVSRRHRAPAGRPGHQHRGRPQGTSARGFWVYGAAAEAPASYGDLDYAGKVALVLGSEGHGLRPLVARTCDALASIPVAAPWRA